jgi:tRNA dimethylallyltransferase
VELALRLGGEVLSMDSMALYRGMDVGTAKATRIERERVPHHLLDVVEPDADFSLAEYLSLAKTTMAEVEARGQVPVFVGGTPLYLKGLLRGVFDGPPAAPDLRRQLLEDATVHGPDSLHRRLALVDPAAAARLHANEIRRIIRALEVHALTGRPISSLQVQFSTASAADARVFVIHWPRILLVERINRRVEEMFERGLVEETRSLKARPGGLGRTASQAVGYQEVLAYLRGDVDLAGTIRAVQVRTRQVAKRQMTWFRSLAECRFVPMADPWDAAGTADRLIELGTHDPTRPAE